MLAKQAHSDEYWMAKALRLARQGLTTTTPNPRVGCVIVKDDQLIGQGYHQIAGSPHAEVHALADAGNKVEGATVYVTLEPCSHHGRTPPCAEALIAAGVARVVCATEDPNPKVAGRGLAMLDAAGIETRSGVQAAAAEALNPGFLRRMRGGYPWLRLKMASSLDGATALASGESQWITGPEARQDVQRGRAQSCAILTGIGTVLSDDPALTVRLPAHQRQPARVVLDTRLRMPATAQILNVPGTTWLLHGPDTDPQTAVRLQKAGARLVELPLLGASLDLTAVMDWMVAQSFNEVWAECGAGLAGGLVRQGLSDEIWLYQAPKFLGSPARPLLDWPIERLDQALSVEVLDLRTVGTDVRWRLRPKWD